ncbi:hypothetical protein H2203_002846 [Taxawa tesnikishii (nom. ined.)]|nr:hypothetical protein H2203_002846 [Dothideales sp. JES 119]
MTVPTVSQLDYGFQAMSLGIHVAINGTHVSITPASNPSRLLSLPPELRNRIYEYVLTRRHRLLPWKRQNIYPVEPALTRTCRQMRSEALGVFTTTIRSLHRF